MRLLILSTLMLSFQAFGADQLFNYCQDKGGKIKKWHICPKSKLPLPIRTCVYKNSYNERQFVNGCSGPSGGYKHIFFNACIKHDLCYHHEPRSNGYSQQKCDYMMLQDSLKACEEQAKNINKCKKWARIMYRGVRIIGKPAYHCANYFGHY